MQGDALDYFPNEGLVMYVIKCPPAGRNDLQLKRLQSRQVMQQSVYALMTQRYIAPCQGLANVMPCCKHFIENALLCYASVMGSTLPSQ